ncbi:hypothetical protein HYPGJ_20189 [Hyphomicrobium sp. GJ21]|nr:hypothetical protein HYPGJ_20189 [Hyphomicrobium sp. GJ21]
MSDANDDKLYDLSKNGGHQFVGLPSEEREQPWP